MVDKELALRTIKLVSTPSRLVPITLKKLFLIKKNSETFFLLTSKGFLFDTQALQYSVGGFILYSMN